MHSTYKDARRWLSWMARRNVSTARTFFILSRAAFEAYSKFVIFLSRLLINDQLGRWVLELKFHRPCRWQAPADQSCSQQRSALQGRVNNQAQALLAFWNLFGRGRLAYAFRLVLDNPFSQTIPSKNSTIVIFFLLLFFKKKSAQ